MRQRGFSLTWPRWTLLTAPSPEPPAAAGPRVELRPARRSRAAEAAAAAHGWGHPRGPLGGGGGGGRDDDRGDDEDGHTKHCRFFGPNEL